MADLSVTFRAPKGELYRAAAERAGLRLSDWLRESCDAALKASGFALEAPETQYALVSDGRLVESPAGNFCTTFRPASDARGEWLPIENIDSAPFDPEKHYRLKPLALRIEGDRVVREYPVIVKSWEHA
ncbi:hypothetical protein [Bradyrhizobium sp. STM 3557]|uniref:hypothetical protein n=1 Tax=Bradyrhizobium sp. STM 3557 TaxID=578920 RepID=UPI00388F52FA